MNHSIILVISHCSHCLQMFVMGSRQPCQYIHHVANIENKNNLSINIYPLISHRLSFVIVLTNSLTRLHEVKK